jgi:hypothetical protein
MAVIAGSDVSLQIFLTEDGAPIDISAATIKQIQIRKGDGSVVIKPATFVTDGTDGGVECQATAAETVTPGEWAYQAYVDTPTWKGYSPSQTFEVEAHL